ncbi:nicotinate-nucleotide pyrophosphorylase [Alkalidesulfovibrio alkalitolerans DSM 16529]|jgi:nicotinate-nucleotide pyrophosphorylase (carboxylating)|uniref:nicotinate-nucleotide diphosphorylase (carboxylating) n=1 Tax=Alkalidesulfovibrio alkalitolerans DSM 16529 TaxID=1121439 RepID=S7T1E8_9BACT|nr:carboxylating nicotinate-nucleotide diphosphorylase [Alkalidesulfovibrio alkalitolerans]EPR30361.1 nicotinate-nucleotide pyrophosphorylase [Alkalidesulfovibrio alkalitolerans DSM 16529]
MSQSLFDAFFQGRARAFLLRSITAALDEDGPDLTSKALFVSGELLAAEIVAKERLIIAGLPILPLVLDVLGNACDNDFRVRLEANDGDVARPGQRLALIEGPAAPLLKAERVMLNFLCHLSGIASLTRRYVDALGESPTRLLDTRKTTPGLRHAEKYAVRVGGALNHRLDLSEMLMLKDTHLDRAGSIREAVATLRKAYSPCPPVIVECRTPDEVREAVAAGADQVLLDNMDPQTISTALAVTPPGVRTEISGGVSLDNIGVLGGLGADFISVGRLTHSAPASDISMRVVRESKQERYR